MKIMIRDEERFQVRCPHQKVLETAVALSLRSDAPSQNDVLIKERRTTIFS